MKIISYPSPNFNQRKQNHPDMIIIHYTGMKTAQEALDRMTEEKEPRVSAHYFINRQGDIYNLVDEKYRAWHAGISCWQGQTDINSRSIGIELENKGHEFGYQHFPKPQIKSLIKLLDHIRQKYDIPDSHIIGHDDIAPMRKQDPGAYFPWHLLARKGHGISPSILRKHYFNKNKKILFDNLTILGYQCDVVRFFTPLNRQVYKNFMQKIRFCPHGSSKRSAKIKFFNTRQIPQGISGILPRNLTQ